MEKQIIIINGTGGSGKDTFIEHVSKYAKVFNFSNCVCFPLPSVPSITNNFPIFFFLSLFVLKKELDYWLRRNLVQ